MEGDCFMKGWEGWKLGEWEDFYGQWLVIIEEGADAEGKISKSFCKVISKGVYAESEDLDICSVCKVDFIKPFIPFLRIFMYSVHHELLVLRRLARRQAIEKYNDETVILLQKKEIEINLLNVWKCHVAQGINQILADFPKLLPKFIFSIPKKHVPFLVQNGELTDYLEAELKGNSVLSDTILLWSAALSYQYPTVRSEGLCKVLLEKLTKMNLSAATHPLDYIIFYLQIVILILRAFPPLMSLVIPVIGKFSSIHGKDPLYQKASLEAATSIKLISAALSSPIYHRPPLYSVLTLL